MHARRMYPTSYRRELEAATCSRDEIEGLSYDERQEDNSKVQDSQRPYLSRVS